MATAAVARRSNGTIKEGSLRLNLAQDEEKNNSGYKTVPRIYSSRDGLIERQLSKVSEKLDNHRDLPEPFLSLKEARQHSELGQEDGSLTFRSLPPIKLSFKKSRNKFMESPKGAISSVLQPSYSIKTHTTGHYVFTEGISKNSTIPNPTFALKNIRVPYSNLPENISIHKEKNKFAFGVKQDTTIPFCGSEYRLSDKPMGIASADLIHHLGTVKEKRGRENKRKGQNKENETLVDKNSGFKCQLAPVDYATGKEFVLDYPYAGRFELEEPVAHETNVSNSTSPTKQVKAKGRERSVSVVSIGESVTPTYFDRAKRKTRKLYPMYDAKAAKKEALTKSKFGIRDISCTKSDTNNKNYNNGTLYRSNTRLSTTLLDLDLSSYEENQSRRNHRSKQKTKGNATRLTPLSNYSPTKQAANDAAYDSDPEFDLSKIYNTRQGRYQLRRVQPKYRKRSHRPISNDSNSSTDLSTMLQNPPPSEISHSILDDATVFGGVDGKTEMVTLLEERERTKTVSAMSVSEQRDHSKMRILGEQIVGDINKSVCFSNTVEFEQAQIIEATPIARADTSHEENSQQLTIQPNQDVQNSVAVLDKVNQIVEPQSDINTNNENLVKEESKYESLADESENDSELNGFPIKAKLITEFEKTIVEEYKEDPGELHNISRNFRAIKSKPRPKATLPVPAVSLDKLSHHPLLPYNPNSNSLSRSLQNTQLDMSIPEKGKQEEMTETNQTLKTMSENFDGQFTIPVTKLELYSRATSRTLLTPAVSLIDEFGGYKQVLISDEILKPDSDRSDKKLVTNTNISFISPLVTEPKAKRQ